MKIVPMQPGDVPITCADVDELASGFDYKRHERETGMKNFTMVF